MSWREKYDRQTDLLDAAFDLLPPEIQLCYNDDCRSWISDGPVDEYSTIECLHCQMHKVLYKKMPEISDELWDRLLEDAADKQNIGGDIESGDWQRQARFLPLSGG